MTVFTTAGKQWVADAMRGSVSTTQQYIGWGTGSTAEAAAQTALITPAAEARTAGAITSPTAALHRTIGTIVSASGQTITEVGLFDASTVGVMMLRAVFAGIPLLTGDSIAFTLDLTIT